MSEEEWRPIIGYEGYYEISDRGNVRSCERNVFHSSGNLMILPSKLKKLTINNKGYYVVQLHKYCTGKTYLVSRLVGVAFIPNPDNLPEIDHIDRVPLNNTVANLRWCTRTINLENRVLIGQKPGISGKKYISVADNGKYRILKTIDGKICHFGYYNTIEEAIEARDKMLAELNV